MSREPRSLSHPSSSSSFLSSSSNPSPSPFPFLHNPAASVSTSTSSNVVISTYVSPPPLGSNVPDCGETPSSPCADVRFAVMDCTVASGGAFERNVRLAVGVYTETGHVWVDENVQLTITGASQTDCIITKPENVLFDLFVVLESNSSLTVHTVTLLVANDDSGVYAMLYAAGDVSTTMTFVDCLITAAATDDGIYGMSVFVNNLYGVFVLDSCTVFNVTTTGWDSLVTFNGSDFLVTNTSFVNVRNAFYIGEGGCFYVSNIRNFTLVHSIFVACSNVYSCGVGLITNLSGSYISSSSGGGGGGAIGSCVFKNTTSGAHCSVLAVYSERKTGAVVGAPLQIENTSFTQCSTLYSPVGALWFEYYVQPLLTACSFTDCVALFPGHTPADSTFGSALYCSQTGWGVTVGGSEESGSAMVRWCVFVRCPHAVAVFARSVFVLEGCVFIGGGQSTGATTTGVGDISVFSSHVQFTACYTDIADVFFSVYCDSADLCAGTIYPRAMYAAATCAHNDFYFFSSSSFGSAEPTDGRCAMPCAADGYACVKPDQCSLGHIAMHGVCVPACAFNFPLLSDSNSSNGDRGSEGVGNDTDANINDDGVCGESSLCVVANYLSSSSSSSYGHPLCTYLCPSGYGPASSSSSSSSGDNHVCVIKTCEERRRTRDNLFSCGPDCVYDTLRSACADTCTQPQHFHADSAGVCVAKTCEDRQRVGRDDDDSEGDGKEDDGDEILQCGPDEDTNTTTTTMGKGEGEGDGDGDGGCYWDTAGDPPRCVQGACTIPQHYHPDTRHVCVLLPCTQRTPLPGATVFPCLSGCYADSPLSGDGDGDSQLHRWRCVEECTEPERYEKDISFGYCVRRLIEGGEEEEEERGDISNNSTQEKKGSTGLLGSGGVVVMVIAIIVAVVVVVVAVMAFIVVQKRKRKGKEKGRDSKARSDSEEKEEDSNNNNCEED